MNALLEQHITELKNEGYTIEVISEGSGDQTRYYVIFKDYKIPSNVWGRESIDLLIIVPALYPNPKLDMFWVFPKLMLPGGKIPEGGNSDESYIGQVWQRFSWHPQTWNPARDNIKMYLEVVNHRLHQRR